MAGRLLQFRVSPLVPEAYGPDGAYEGLYWDVILYDCPRALTKSVNRYKPYCDNGHSGKRGYAAITCPLPVLQIEKRDRNSFESLAPCLGRVYLLDDALEPSVVAHETVHMATSTMRAVALVKTSEDETRGGVDLTDDIGDTEEVLAHLQSSYYWSISGVLFSHRPSPLLRKVRQKE